MIPFTALCLLAAADPSALLPLLRGIDQVPTAAAVAAADVSALIAVALNDEAKLVHRARALRLLGVRARVGHGDDIDVDADVVAAIVTLRSSPIASLRVHAALAQGALAARQEQLLPFAVALLLDDDAEMRRAALTLLWVDRTQGARAVVRAHALCEKNAELLHLAQARLASWPPPLAQVPRQAVPP